MRYKIDYQNVLNEKQLEAVMHHEGPCLVIAGAGTGKTRTLVHRVARLIEDGVRPGSILCLTFTRKAAESMTDKCSKMLDQRCQFINSNTFHGFALSELKHYAAYTGYGRDFTVIDQEDVESALALVKVELKTDTLSCILPKNSQLRSILSKAMTKLMTIPDVIESYYPKYKLLTSQIELIASEFKKFKKEQNKMDYDDLLLNFLELMKRNEFVGRTIQNKYRFIMIDEYQDTDRIQAEIVKQLADGHRNIMVVGDDAQSIYAFRGADYRNIMSFPRLFENTRIITIEKNYRSTKEILDLGNAVMTNATDRYEKNLYTDQLGGHKPELIRVSDNYDESLFVADKIEFYINDGIPFKNIAVLFRNGNFSYDLETVLRKRGLPFRKYGGIEFGQKKHIKDVVAFLKVGMNNEDILSWQRVLMLLKGIGDKKAKKIIDRIVTEKNGTAYLREIGQADLYHLIEFLSISREGPEGKIRRIAEYYKPIFEDENQYGKKKWKDIEALIKVAANHVSCVDFINSVVMNSNNGDDENSAEEKEKEFISLSTIHSAKGLEWNVVFILSVNDGCMPYMPGSKTREEMDEEVRLLHVAITRAEKHLYIMTPQNQYQEGQGKEKEDKLSRFLTDEIVAECLEEVTR